MCKKLSPSSQDKESDLVCLLRHIRNSIAHGYVSCQKSKQTYYLVFEDHNEEKHMTAKIVCSKDDLAQWKEIISP